MDSNQPVYNKEGQKTPFGKSNISLVFRFESALQSKEILACSPLYPGNIEGSYL
jgi:hypothetical protein